MRVPSPDSNARGLRLFGGLHPGLGTGTPVKYTTFVLLPEKHSLLKSPPLPPSRGEFLRFEIISLNIPASPPLPPSRGEFLRLELELLNIPALLSPAGSSIHG